MASKWMAHLMAVKRKYPGKSLAECMKIASRTYKR